MASNYWPQMPGKMYVFFLASRHTHTWTNLATGREGIAWVKNYDSHLRTMAIPEEEEDDTVSVSEVVAGEGNRR